jgi:NAD(P)-dependent dehydrogenase (short-subunit alcohol dehydrogenase family)
MSVLVIGGGSGIGAAVVKALPEACLYVAPSKQTFDVRDRELTFLTNKACEEVTELVYCAGTNRLQNLDAIHNLDFLDILAVNVVGFTNVLSWLLRYNAPLKSVVAVSSDAAVRPMRGSTMYCASKAALDMAVRTAARELAPKVRVNAVAPGMTSGTKMTEYIDAYVPAFRGWTPEQAREYEQSGIPMGRRADPEEVADLIISVLFGPEYLTGAIIPINGGRS